MRNEARSFAMFVASALSAITLLTISLGTIQGAGDLTRITVASSSDRASGVFTGVVGLSLDSDGTKIAFHSDSDFLAQGIPRNQTEIWLYDIGTMSLTRVTTASAGPGYHFSMSPRQSGDGTTIVFDSNSDFLNQGVPTGTDEIWSFDTRSMTLTRVTTAISPNCYSEYPDVNYDGTKIVFESNANFLGGQGSRLGAHEIWLYDTTTMTFTRVTSTSGDGYRSNEYPRLSADGSKVVFSSNSDFFNQGVSTYEIWLFDMQSMTLTQVTTGCGWCYHPSINADGTRVVFDSETDFLGQGNPAWHSQIWLYDTKTMTFTRITAPDNDSRSPDISADGKKIAFKSRLDFLRQGIASDHYEIWLYDTESMTYTRVTSTTKDGYRSVDFPRLAKNGKVVAFASDFDLLGQGNIAEGQYEVWLQDTSAEDTYSVYLPVIMRNGSLH